ncbi:MAG: DUF1549 domain-containing protein [Planctomycetota bacterium]
MPTLPAISALIPAVPDFSGSVWRFVIGVTAFALQILSLPALCVAQSAPPAPPAPPALPAPSFLNDILPLLTRYDCNSGGCHGKLAGQNGFRLSLRGYAPEADFESLTRESRGRRVNPAAPGASLLVAKANGSVAHAGGRRILPGSDAERLLLEWIRAGMPGPDASEPVLDHLKISPLSAVLQPADQTQLTATAVYTDGRLRDVTWLARFASGDASLLDVDASGRVQALRHGEHVVRVSFQGQVEVATFTIPRTDTISPEVFAAGSQPIDQHVFGRLQSLGIPPSAAADDATFLRRSMLDALGTLPTPAEQRAFLADSSSDKRARLIDSLLQRPEFHDYWALQLGDLLQNRIERDHDVRGRKGVRSFHQWIRQQLVAGRNWRQLATDVLLASGSTSQHPAVGYYIVTIGEKSAEESDIADSVAQAFLGTRIGCARCHNHPLERYTQDDYYHFVAFFTRLALQRRSPDDGETSLQVATRHVLNLRQQLSEQQAKLQQSPSLAEDEQLRIRQRISELEQEIERNMQAPVTVRQPRTGAQLPPRHLDRSPIEIAPGEDPRIPFVRWMTAPANRAFSGAMVNRLWKHFLGTGLVEPVDDLRATNPPSNPALWNYLNDEFVQSDFDLRHLMRLIMNSETYRRSSATLPQNRYDQRFHSHAQARRLPAEVLLDAISQATGEPEPFAGYPLGIRAIQVPDPGLDSYFLTLFGRSERVTACACERSGDVTLPQLLHLQNSDSLTARIRAPEGRLQQLLATSATDIEVITELFLAVLCRPPRDEERAAIESQLATAGTHDRAAVLQDLFWVLLNSREFAFQH